MSTPIPKPPFRDPARPLRERVDDLLDRLTTGEKLALLHQHQAPVHRLGMDSFRTGTEALHGVAWHGPATVFPQAIGLASTWNPELVRAIGSAVGDEVRVFHQKDPAAIGLNVWAPVVNPLRDPRWGRNEEGYAEDPWLTGVIATAYGRGLTGDHPTYLKTAPTLKHFLAYNNETDRCTSSSNLPPRVLHDYELPAFRAPIEAGAAVAVMPSYNLVNGRPAHLSPLINDVLRKYTDQELLVVSDAYAPNNLFGLQEYLPDGPTAYAAALKAGVDSFTQDGVDAGPSIEKLNEAMDRGLITVDEVDTAVRHALAIRFRLGEFDPPELDPYRSLEPDLVNCPAHRRLAHEVARQSLVLLKHECQVLPLNTSTIKRLAVIGPLAKTLSEDWYAGTLPYQITAYDGLVERLGHDRVDYYEGVDRIALRIAGSTSYLHVGTDGVLRAGADGVVAADGGSGADGALRADGVAGADGGHLRAFEFQPARSAVTASPAAVGADGVVAAGSGLGADGGLGSDGALQPDGGVGADGEVGAGAGEHRCFDLFDWGGGACALRSVGNGRHLSVADDGSLVADQAGPNGWEVKQTFRLVEAGGTVRVLHLNSGRYLHVDEVVSLSETGTNFELEVVVDGAAEAAKVAARADTTIVVVGNHPLVNGRETEDRDDLELPRAQDRLLRSVHAANSRTVLVMTSSYPFAVGWAQQNLPAVLWSAHGGQEYGRALADVLFGDADPAGRLTQTWYHSAADLPDLLDYDIIATDATYLYYRGMPLYPFGHGLSYTTFAYGDLRLNSTSIPADGEVRVTFTVTNTGTRAGSEVAQLYTHQQRSRVKQPLRQLRGFRRLSLLPGESTDVELTIAAADLGFWDVTRDRHCVETARHSIMIGRSSTDTRLAATLDVQGEHIPPRPIDHLAATSFDDYSAITLTTATRDRGDAVISLEPGAWLSFDYVELAHMSYKASVANRGSAPATIELRLDDPWHGDLLDKLQVSPSDKLTSLSGQLTATGLHTLYVVFSAPDLVLESFTT